jgi:cobaltochelatase CobS
VAINVRDVFGFDTDMKVMGFAQADEHVPDLDPDYIFDRDTTLAILASFVHNRRVMIQGYHGTGKSTHIEHVISPLHRTDRSVGLECAHRIAVRRARIERDRGAHGASVSSASVTPALRAACAWTAMQLSQRVVTATASAISSLVFASSAPLPF